jgi:hypothetical protein
MGYILYLLCLPIPLFPSLSLSCLLLCSVCLFLSNCPDLCSFCLSCCSILCSVCLPHCTLLLFCLVSASFPLFCLYEPTLISMFCLPVPLSSPCSAYLSRCPLFCSTVSSWSAVRSAVPSAYSAPSSVLPAWSSLPPQFFCLSHCPCRCSVRLSRSIPLLCLP